MLVLTLANDVDPRTLDLSGITRIDLQFPAFTDGRAYSQAFLLRRRLRFAGELRATGDVLIDQLVQMQRTGFDVAVLKEGVDASAAQRQLDRYAGFYQGSAVETQPHFAKDGLMTSSLIAQRNAPRPRPPNCYTPKPAPTLPPNCSKHRPCCNALRPSFRPSRKPPVWAPKMW